MKQISFLALFLLSAFFSACSHEGEETKNNPENTPHKEPVSFNVKIQNLSSELLLSSGVFLVHTSEFQLPKTGEMAHESLKPLAEDANAKEFLTYAKTLPGVLDARIIHGDTKPNASVIYPQKITERGEIYLSGIRMIVGANDGIAVVRNIPLFSGNDPKLSEQKGYNLDIGTEENSPINSGIEGGQYDISKRKESIGQGTPTDPQQSISDHPYFPEALMKVIAEPVKQAS